MSAILTPAKVRQIRRLSGKRNRMEGFIWTQRRLAKRYGVSRSCVYGVLSGESWSSVK